MRITWLDRQDIVQYHAELIAEHGGLQGPPNEGALDSTLARPRSYLAYNPRCSVFELAARYGFGFARNHSFPDGNKRLALVTIDVFLMANGYELTATEVEAVATITSLAAGEVTEDQLAEWIEANAHPLEHEI